MKPKECLEVMQVLQRRLPEGATPEIAALRVQVPAPVLAHFDRLIAQRRKGVAEVHHGVCGACHLRLPAALTGPKNKHEDLHLCENCGAYLIFPIAEAAPAELPVMRKPRRRTAAVV